MSKSLFEHTRFKSIIKSKITKIKLELITDSDMYIFVEKETRGGFFCIPNRYSKVNNKYLKSYDQSKNQNILYT